MDSKVRVRSNEYKTSFLKLRARNNHPKIRDSFNFFFIFFVFPLFLLKKEKYADAIAELTPISEKRDLIAAVPYALIHFLNCSNQPNGNHNLLSRHHHLILFTSLSLSLKTNRNFNRLLGLNSIRILLLLCIIHFPFFITMRE